MHKIFFFYNKIIFIKRSATFSHFIMSLYAVYLPKRSAILPFIRSAKVSVFETYQLVDTLLREGTQQKKYAFFCQFRQKTMFFFAKKITILFSLIYPLLPFSGLRAVCPSELYVFRDCEGPPESMHIWGFFLEQGQQMPLRIAHTECGSCLRVWAAPTVCSIG